MKKNAILALLLLFLFLFLASSLFAQTKTTVYGNLGVENVNISIVNTQYPFRCQTRQIHQTSRVSLQLPP